MGELVCGDEEKRKIGVFVHIKASAGGSFQYVEFILGALYELRDVYESTIIYTTEEWEKILENSYAKFHKYKIKFRYDGMAQEIDSMNFDYIIFPVQGPWFFYELQFRTPLITVVHDLMYYYYPKPNAIYMRSTSFYQALQRRSVGIFTDSSLGKSQYMEIFGKGAECIIYPLPFRAPNYIYDEKETEIKVKNKKFIFYPALTQPHKNHMNLLLAIDFLREKGVIVNLLFSGLQDSLYGYLSSLSSRLGLDEQVEFVGYVSGAQLKYLYAHARAMIFPTYDGPTNIPIIEAMYMGCPVAVSNLYAMPKMVGDAGILFDPRLVWDIANTLKCLWEDDALCKRLAMNGKTQARMFSKEKFNERFADGIRRMISGYEKDFLHINELASMCKLYKNVYIYGAGEIGFLIGYYLISRKINICGYIVSRLENNPRNMLGIPVLCLEDMRANLKDEIVILAMDEKHQNEVEKYVRKIEVRKTTEREKVEAWLYYVRSN